MSEIFERAACKLCTLYQKCSRMKLSGRGNLLRRMNSAPSPTSQMLADSLGKENLVVNRNTLTPLDTSSTDVKENYLSQQWGSSHAIRIPLEEQDTNSQDSGCSDDTADVRFAVPSGFAPRKGVEPSPGKCWFGDDALSPGRVRAPSLVAPSPPPGSYKIKSMRSLSFCSTDSFDDGFSEIPELDKPDNAPAALGSLLTKPLITSTGDDENDSPSFIQRIPIRRAFSLVENKEDHLRATRDLQETKTVKRTLETSENCLIKRRKANVQTEGRHKIQRSASESCATQLSSKLSSLYGRPELIGDLSGPFVLPVVTGKHVDLTSISASTLASVLRGDYESTIRSYTIIDCRYPYEFEGGRIRGARNLFTCEQVEAALMNGKSIQPTYNSGHDSGRDILIFHCEFSLLRGPSLYRWLRRIDRKQSTCYPSLQYPEVYLLHGGYQNFYENFPELCDPVGYIPMGDPNHEADLRKFRSKSSSWNGNRTSFKRLHLC